MKRLKIGKRKETLLQKPNLNAKKLETEKPISETQRRLNSQLLLVAQDGRPYEVKVLLETGADVESRNKSGTTALSVAARHGYTDVCALLIGWRANVNATANNGMTALMRAAWYGHTETCALLIENGADMEAKDNENKTAAEASLVGKTTAFLKLAAYVDSSMGKGSFRLFLSSFNKCFGS